MQLFVLCFVTTFLSAEGNRRNPNDIFGNEYDGEKFAMAGIRNSNPEEDSLSCSEVTRHLISVALRHHRRYPDKKDMGLLLDFSLEEISVLIAFEQHLVSESAANKALLSAMRRMRFNILHILPYEYLSNFSNNLILAVKSPQFSIAATVIAMLLVMTYLTVYFRSMKLAAVGVFMFIVIVGFGWNWFHLYQKALAQQERILVREGYTLPSECIRSQRPWYYSTYVFLFGDGNVCKEWFHARHVSPLSSVNPSEVFSKSISMLFFQPITASLDIIYDITGKYTEGLPPWLAAPVSIILFVMLFFTTILLFSWSILIAFDTNLKFWCFGAGFEITKPNRSYIQDVEPNSPLLAKPANYLKPTPLTNVETATKPNNPPLRRRKFRRYDTDLMISDSPVRRRRLSM